MRLSFWPFRSRTPEAPAPAGGAEASEPSNSPPLESSHPDVSTLSVTAAPEAAASYARAIAESPAFGFGAMGETPPRGLPLYAWDQPWIHASPRSPRRKPDALISVDDLRRMADTYDIARACILHLQREVSAVPIRLVARDDKEGSKKDERRIRSAELWFRPDGGIGGPGRTREQFERMLIEDLCVIGAAALYYAPTRALGPYAVLPVDAATIRPRVDPFGWPGPGEIVFEQWVLDRPVGGFTRERMSYDGIWPVAHSPYYKSPLEWLILTTIAALKADEWNRGWLTDGNMPSDLIAVPEDWKPGDIRSYSEWWDNLLAGDMKRRVKTKFVPSGTSRLMNPTRKDQEFQALELWLARRTCAIFGVQMASIGFTGEQYKVSQEESMAQTTEFGAGVLLEYRKEKYDDILRRLGYEDLECLNVTDQAEGKAERAERLTKACGAPYLTINEARAEDGKEGIEGGDVLLVPAGVLPLEDLVAQSELATAQSEQQLEQGEMGLTPGMGGGGEDGTGGGGEGPPAGPEGPSFPGPRGYVSPEEEADALLLARTELEARLQGEGGHTPVERKEAGHVDPGAGKAHEGHWVMVEGNPVFIAAGTAETHPLRQKAKSAVHGKMAAHAKAVEQTGQVHETKAKQFEALKEKHAPKGEKLAAKEAHAKLAVAEGKHPPERAGEMLGHMEAAISALHSQAQAAFHAGQEGTAESLLAAAKTLQENAHYWQAQVTAHEETGKKEKLSLQFVKGHKPEESALETQTQMAHENAIHKAEANNHDPDAMKQMADIAKDNADNFQANSDEHEQNALHLHGEGDIDGATHHAKLHGNSAALAHYWKEHHKALSAIHHVHSQAKLSQAAEAQAHEAGLQDAQSGGLSQEAHEALAMEQADAAKTLLKHAVEAHLSGDTATASSLAAAAKNKLYTAAVSKSAATEMAVQAEEDEKAKAQSQLTPREAKGSPGGPAWGKEEHPHLPGVDPSYHGEYTPEHAKEFAEGVDPESFPPEFLQNAYEGNHEALLKNIQDHKTTGDPKALTQANLLQKYTLNTAAVMQKKGMPIPGGEGQDGAPAASGSPSGTPPSQHPVDMSLTGNWISDETKQKAYEKGHAAGLTDEHGHGHATPSKVAAAYQDYKDASNQANKSGLEADQVKAKQAAAKWHYLSGYHEGWKTGKPEPDNQHPMEKLATPHKASLEKQEQLAKQGLSENPHFPLSDAEEAAAEHLENYNNLLAAAKKAHAEGDTEEAESYAAQAAEAKIEHHYWQSTVENHPETLAAMGEPEDEGAPPAPQAAPTTQSTFGTKSNSFLPHPHHPDVHPDYHATPELIESAKQLAAGIPATQSIDQAKEQYQKAHEGAELNAEAGSKASSQFFSKHAIKWGEWLKAQGEEPTHPSAATASGQGAGDLTSASDDHPLAPQWTPSPEEIEAAKQNSLQALEKDVDLGAPVSYHETKAGHESALADYEGWIEEAKAKHEAGDAETAATYAQQAKSALLEAHAHKAYLDAHPDAPKGEATSASDDDHPLAPHWTPADEAIEEQKDHGLDALQQDLADGETIPPEEAMAKHDALLSQAAAHKAHAKTLYAEGKHAAAETAATLAANKHAEAHGHKAYAEAHPDYEAKEAPVESAPEPTPAAPKTKKTKKTKEAPPPDPNVFLNAHTEHLPEELKSEHTLSEADHTKAKQSGLYAKDAVSHEEGKTHLARHLKTALEHAQKAKALHEAGDTAGAKEAAAASLQSAKMAAKWHYHGELTKPQPKVPTATPPSHDKANAHLAALPEELHGKASLSPAKIQEKTQEGIAQAASGKHTAESATEKANYHLEKLAKDAKTAANHHKKGKAAQADHYLKYVNYHAEKAVEHHALAQALGGAGAEALQPDTSLYETPGATGDGPHKTVAWSAAVSHKPKGFEHYKGTLSGSAHAQQAHTHYAAWVGSLTNAEHNDIAYYTTESGYKAINWPLWAGDEHAAGTTLAKKTANIQKALLRSSLAEDQILLRGTCLPDTPENNPANWQKGKVVNQAGFVSTTSQAGTAEKFAKDYQPIKIVYKIYAKKGQKGANIHNVTTFTHEQEVLLPRNTKFLVQHVEKTQLGSKSAWLVHVHIADQE